MQAGEYCEHSSVLYPTEMSRGKESIPVVGVSGSQGGTVKWPRESGRLSDRQIGITWRGGGREILCIVAIIDGPPCLPRSGSLVCWETKGKRKSAVAQAARRILY